MDTVIERRPPWLTRKIDFRALSATQEKLAGLNLHTVCIQARCPNISECFGRGTATFLILGNVCTRACAFCNVGKGKPGTVDRGEPERVATAVQKLGIQYAVITSVTRDDLDDGGASMFAETIRRIKTAGEGIRVEVLVPDFSGHADSIDTVIDANPDVFGHNMETVPSLYGIRKGADYARSLAVLGHAFSRGGLTKSSVMLGLGETREEVLLTLADIRRTGCSIVCIGQYLQPDASHHPVREYASPGEFEFYREEALRMGFSHVESGPYVRSSYRAEKAIEAGTTERHWTGRPTNVHAV